MTMTRKVSQFKVRCLIFAEPRQQTNDTTLSVGVINMHIFGPKVHFGDHYAAAHAVKYLL